MLSGFQQLPGCKYIHTFIIYLYTLYNFIFRETPLAKLPGTEFEAQAAAPEEKRQRVSFSSEVLKVEDPTQYTEFVGVDTC